MISNKPTFLKFYFESAANKGYVGVFANSKLIDGNIATQNAGSTNFGIYYQVGGGGLNGIFAQALTSSGQLKRVNQQLIERYNEKYGDGTYERDSSKGVQNKLTSFLVPLTHDNTSGIGANVVGMMYSVGPVLGRDGITDRSQYSQIYADAVTEVMNSNKLSDNPIVGLRITMLSTGIYASSVDNVDDLFRDSAELIIRGIVEAYKNLGVGFPLDILINTNHDQTNKEVNGFTSAIRAVSDLAITMNSGGFTIQIPD